LIASLSFSVLHRKTTRATLFIIGYDCSQLPSVGDPLLKSLYTLAGALALCLILVSCTAGSINIPPVASPADGQRLPGKVVWRDLIADSPQATMRFYGDLFGWEFEPLGAGINYTLIRHRGRPIGGMVDQNQLPTRADISQWVVVMAVEDIDSAAGQVAEGGGQVLTPPTSLGDRGRIAVVTDPQGAVLSLLQTRDGDPADSAVESRPGDFLWDELWTSDPDSARRFLQGLAPFRSEAMTLGSQEMPVDYRLLTTGDRPRAGIRPLPDPAMSPTWVSFLQVADEAALDDILARVESLGGRVLVPAMARPRGGKVAIVADPSGAGIGLQTWSDKK
jgi:predicted enzyme related to lactoylglutathione lyase